MAVPSANTRTGVSPCRDDAFSMSGYTGYFYFTPWIQLHVLPVFMIPSSHVEDAFLAAFVDALLVHEESKTLRVDKDAFVQIHRQCQLQPQNVINASTGTLAKR